MKSSKISLKAKILCGVLAGGVILSAGSSAFAASQNASNSTENSKIEYKVPMDRNKFHEERMAEMNKILQEVLKEAVASNIITQEESDQIKAYKDKRDQQKEENKLSKDKGIGKEGKGGFWAELVSEGILTKEKADILREKIHEKNQVLREANLKQNLSKLVENKTLTQEQADKIAAAIKAENDARKAAFEKTKNMTEEKRHEYMQSIKDSRKDPIKALLDNGTITEAQEKEVRKILPGHKNKHNGPGVKGNMPSNAQIQKNATK